MPVEWGDMLPHLEVVQITYKIWIICVKFSTKAAWQKCGKNCATDAKLNHTCISGHKTCISTCQSDSLEEFRDIVAHEYFV